MRRTSPEARRESLENEDPMRHDRPGKSLRLCVTGARTMTGDRAHRSPLSQWNGVICLPRKRARARREKKAREGERIIEIGVIL